MNKFIINNAQTAEKFGINFTSEKGKVSYIEFFCNTTNPYFWGMSVYGSAHNFPTRLCEIDTAYASSSKKRMTKQEVINLFA